MNRREFTTSLGLGALAVGLGGIIIWAIAKETGKFDSLLRYPGEDSEYENAKMDKLGL